jgi:arsenate reductase (thioredoxin)
MRVLFVCLHGAAKSVIAVEQFRQLAAEAGLSWEALSAGVEPDDEVPARVVQALRDEGIDLSGFHPRRVTPELVGDATHVVSFGCDLSELAPGGAEIEQWGEVPAVSDGYETARTAIAERVRALVERLASRPTTEV